MLQWWGVGGRREARQRRLGLPEVFRGGRLGASWVGSKQRRES